jgi:GT2 family glycosyltransferase
VIEHNTLHQLYEYAECNNIGICGSVLKYYHAPNSIQAYGGRLNTFFGTTSHNKTIRMLNKRLDDIIGAAFFLNKEVILNLGFLPEEYFLYMEETDYCFNARKCGFKLGIAIDSIVYHKEGASIGASSKNNETKSEFADLLSIKNRIKFHRKYLGGGLGMYLGIVATIINRIKRRQWKRAVKVVKLLNH